MHCYGDKTPDEKKLKGQRICFGSKSIMVGEEWRQECEQLVTQSFMVGEAGV